MTYDRIVEGRFIQRPNRRQIHQFAINNCALIPLFDQERQFFSIFAFAFAHQRGHYKYFRTRWDFHSPIDHFCNRL